MTYKQIIISHEDCSKDELLDLYYKYEFSDKVMVLEESINYGSLYNYVKTGILTEKELEELIDMLQKGLKA